MEVCSNKAAMGSQNEMVHKDVEIVWGFFLFNEHYLQWHVCLVFCASFWKEITIVHVFQTSS